MVVKNYFVFLKALEGDGDDDSPEPEPEPRPSLSPPKAAPRKPSPDRSGASKPPQKAVSGGGDVQVVSDRLELYRQALKQAEVAGESSKARRYKRSIATLEQV